MAASIMRKLGTSTLRMTWKQVIWMHYLLRLIKSMRQDWLSRYEASDPAALLAARYDRLG